MSSATRFHLLPSTQRLVDSADDLRIRCIRTDRWIGYTRAEAALAELDDLLRFPKRTRMPNLILIGATNNGKSMIVEKFRRLHDEGERGDDEEDAGMRMPVLKVQMPSGPDEKRFFGAILAALGAPDALNECLLPRQQTVRTMMVAASVHMLIIDELHNLLAGQRNQQRRFLNLLRWLGNELQIPLVGVGTAEALRAIQSDDQLANRFKPFVLPLWRADAEYLRLLNTLEAVLPLRRPSGLSEPALARKILALAEGVLGEITTVVTQAAVSAITSGEESISLATLEALSFLPPTQRRHAAE